MPLPLTKTRIMELLQKGPYDIDEDRSLLLRIGDFLHESLDQEVIQKTERAYGKPFAKLVPFMLKKARMDFADLCPPELNWLKRWMEATRFSEAPGSYHMLSSLILTSTLLDRKMKIDMGQYIVYPPIAGILVGPSGNRKNSAIDIAMEILENFPDKDDLRIIQEKITPEALFSSINQTDPDLSATALLISPELAVTLGKQSYLTGMVPTLTRLMDHATKVSTNTKHGGELVAYNVGFGFLGGTTEDWIVSAMPPDVVGGGFTSRVLFTVEPQTIRACLGGPQFINHRKNIEALSEELVINIDRAPAGNVEIEGTAWEFMENWYMLHRFSADHTLVEAPYLSRKHVHILRIALALCVMDGDFKIQQKHIAGALKILKYIEPGMFSMFQRLTAPQSAVDASVLVELIRENGGKMLRQHILKTVGNSMSMQRVREALDYMTDSGMAFRHGENDAQVLKVPT